MFIFGGNSHCNAFGLQNSSTCTHAPAAWYCQSSLAPNIPRTKLSRGFLIKKKKTRSWGQYKIYWNDIAIQGLEWWSWLGWTACPYAVDQQICWSCPVQLWTESTKHDANSRICTGTEVPLHHQVKSWCLSVTSFRKHLGNQQESTALPSRCGCPHRLLFQTSSTRCWKVASAPSIPLGSWTVWAHGRTQRLLLVIPKMWSAQPLWDLLDPHQSNSTTCTSSAWTLLLV